MFKNFVQCVADKYGLASLRNLSQTCTRWYESLECYKLKQEIQSKQFSLQEVAKTSFWANKNGCPSMRYALQRLRMKGWENENGWNIWRKRLLGAV